MYCNQESCVQYNNIITISVSKQKEIVTDNASKLNFEIISESSKLVHFKPMGMLRKMNKLMQYSMRAICNCAVFSALSNPRNQLD